MNEYRKDENSLTPPDYMKDWNAINEAKDLRSALKTHFQYLAGEEKSKQLLARILEEVLESLMKISLLTNQRRVGV